MPAFRFGHATAADVDECIGQCLAQLGPPDSGPGRLGFVYFTDYFAPHAAAIVARLREGTAVDHWVGSVGIGVVASGHEYLDRPAIVAMIGDFEPGSFRVFPTIATREAVVSGVLDTPVGPANFAVVHGDPENGLVPELIVDLARHAESGFLVGGLGSSRRANVQVAGGVTAGGLSGAAFSGDVAIATRLTQGCSPMGAKHVITECQRNIVVALDGKPALDVLKADVGEKLARDLPRLGGYLFVGLPIPGSDTDDYLVRHLVGIDPDSKLIAIGDVPVQGRSLMFCRRDRESAAADMRRMLDSIQQGLFAPPRGALYYSCLGRGPNLFGDESAELGMIRNALGDVPLVGFFCNGEISHNRLYGYTGVLTLFA